MKIFFLCLIFSLSVRAEDLDDTGPLPSYIPHIRTEVTSKEKLLNFSIIYGAQWAYYVTGQHSIIKDHGSWHNWLNHPFSPHFDKDSFEYNIFRHSLTGNYYYLWYRSRGYSIQRSFFWSFMSSLAFEFTIETVTERPSWQDIYLTPVFGTVIGVGVEKLSRTLHETDSWWGHSLGYLLNPFTLLPETTHESVSFQPIIDRKTLGASVSYRF